METRKTVNDCAIKSDSKVNNPVFNPIIKQEIIVDQIFNGIIKREIVDETNHNNDSQLLQTGTICLTEENVKAINTKIKIETDVIDNYEYRGTIFKETHSSELITTMNLDKRSNFKKKQNTCNDTFNSKGLLTRHVSSHDINKRKKQLFCATCNESYYNKTHLKKHLMLHTQEQAFSQAPTLKILTKIHTGKKLYKRDICEKRISTVSDLTKPKRTHTKKKMYKSDTCNKRSSTASNLRKHTRTHTREKTCKCDICNKTFTYKSQLKIHARTHTGEKPYKCDNCVKSFSQLSTLKTHERTHTGEKPYKCDNCVKSFSQKSSLKTHARKHTGEKPYSCKSFFEKRKAQCQEAKQKIIKHQQEKKNKFYNRKVGAIDYRIGDLVALKRKQFLPLSKKKSEYLGPYRITGRCGPNRYAVWKVGSGEGPEKTSTGTDFMRKWKDGLTLDEYDEDSVSDADSA